MMRCNQVFAVDSENEFDVDEPEESVDHSDEEWNPTAASKRSGKRKEPRRIASSRKKKPKVSEEEKTKILPKKKRKSKSKSPAPEVVPEEDIDFDEEDDIEEKLNQGPGEKPAEKFTSGAFVVLKTDMNLKGNPRVWKIDGKILLQMYIPFKQDCKTLYKSTSVYSGWGTNIREKYYSAPVSFIKQSNKEHIIKFYKNKIKKDPRVKGAFKKSTEPNKKV